MLRRYEEKKTRLVVGLMSGTSVDGIDAALVRIEGPAEAPRAAMLAFENAPYPKEVREKIFGLFQTEKATVDRVGEMNFLLGELFAEAALAVVRKAGLRPEEIDLIGSHGQTVYHHPEQVSASGFTFRYTVQIGEGAVIAERTGIPCVSDFRVADMAAGGQGAPLVPFTEYLLSRRPRETVLLLNLGGVANVTVLPAGRGPEDVSAFDTGPADMVIDGLMEALFRLPMDRDGKTATGGKIDDGLLEYMLRDPYFTAPPPKTTGRERFGSEYVGRVLNYAESNGIVPGDAVATAAMLTARSVSDAYRRFIAPRYAASELIASGGGSYNPYLMDLLKNEMAKAGVRVSTQEETGRNGDAKEAAAFALLADRAALGLPNCLPGVTGARSAAVMGKLSLPSCRERK